MTSARAAAGAPARPRRAIVRAAFASLLTLAFAGFVALGMWQLQRMSWKHALIERVEARIHEEPAAPPARVQWPAVTAEEHAYRRVRLSGRYLDVPEARAQAVTQLGGGWWVLAPFLTDAGDVVLVNRGFVPTGESAAAPPRGPTEVVGLLRIGEPGGGFLRRNDPEGDRWFSRDVQAIAATRGLEDAAPYFVDAGRDPTAGDAWPAGGLTVVRFRDHHLVYALTWFGLALLTALAGARLFLLERPVRQDAGRDRAQSPGEPTDAGSAAGR